MIKEIISEWWYLQKPVLEMILKSSKSKKVWYTQYFEILPDPYEYVNKFCENRNLPDGYKYVDLLKDMLFRLEFEWAVNETWLIPQKNPDKYDHTDLISDWFTDSETWEIPEPAPWEQAKLYIEYGWPYYIDCDMEKVKLFYDIVFGSRKYICKLGTIKALIRFLPEIDKESFLDWMELGEKYIFSDPEVLIYSIVSSSRLNVAKMYYYFSKHISDNDWENFIKWPLEFENEVVSSRNSNFNENEHIDGYKEFWFNSSLDKEFEPKRKQDLLIAWTVSYDPSTKQMKIWDKYVSFKTAPKQATFIEYLIENRGRSISSTEVSKIGITDIKRSIDDIKKKMKEREVSQRQRKDIFHYFEDEWVKYCRILL